MRVAIVENTAITHHGQIGVALHEAGALISQYRPWRDGLLPEVEAYDALVVFGGEQTALADESHPYLPALAARMRAFSAQDKAVLGICLGAQILARAFGAQNLIGSAPEFGWCVVDVTDAGQGDPLLAGIDQRFRAFQLHSDTFTIPAMAVRLAGTDIAPSQAFRIGRATYGTQFHFEASCNVVADWDRKFRPIFDALTPDWADIYPKTKDLHGQTADEIGLRIARNWVALI